MACDVGFTAPLKPAPVDDIAFVSAAAVAAASRSFSFFFLRFSSLSVALSLCSFSLPSENKEPDQIERFLN